MTVNAVAETPAVLSVIVVDDEAPARARLRDLLADIALEFPNEVVAEAENGVLALAALECRAVDLALVDIRMPTMDGIELARHLALLAQPPAVVFVTAYDAYAVQAFELNAVDYLLKPVRAQRLLAALKKAVAKRLVGADILAAVRQNARSHLSCHERGRLLLVPVSEIIYFKADRKYVTARTREREYLLDESLAQLEEEFREQFIRLHRSTLAAKEAIGGFEKSDSEDADTLWQAILQGIPERLPVSRRQWPMVKSYVRQPGV